MAPYVSTWNLSAISVAKSNYGVSKWDINDIHCELECQLRCKNEGDTVTSYLDPASAHYAICDYSAISNKSSLGKSKP